MVRAKFRVMDISQRWNGKLTSVRLLPVTAKSSNNPDGSEENAAFWKATPSGHAELVFKGFNTPYKIGQCLYIDMHQLDHTPDETKRYWKLESVKTSHSMEICLDFGWVDEPMTNGTIVMNIHNENAWPSFQGKHLTYWNVSFVPG